MSCIRVLQGVLGGGGRGSSKKGPQKGFYTGLWDASGLEGLRIYRLLGFGLQGFLGISGSGAYGGGLTWFVVLDGETSSS